MSTTPHNEAKKSEIAKIVLMPGDPLRAQKAALKFLKNPKLVNKVRGMYAYTGTYKNKRVTIMAHGMGMPSIGIYSYELYKFYDVDCIIRFGTAGAYKKEINVGDVIIADAAFSTSTYAKDLGIKNAPKILKPTPVVLKKAIEAAKEMKIKYHTTQVVSEDVFYNHYSLAEKIRRSKNSSAVEMEAYALYANAIYLKKKALTILTCSDSMVTNESMSADQRQEKTETMIQLALNTAIKMMK
ncbi:MAG: purine-nucleoside phosphorylase [Mycoplasmoidaceae bacterium]|nr:purine-nucleoside phosphorylase [Mycoplasmoidaceae bacterium]